LLIALFSCVTPKKEQLAPCTDLAERETIIQKIMDLPNLQWVYHPEIEDRLPVKLLESDYVPKSLNLIKFQQSVQIISLRKILEGNSKHYELVLTFCF